MQFKMISEPNSVNDNFRAHSQARREYCAAKATALDAARFPTPAAHWPGFLLIGGRLAFRVEVIGTATERGAND